MTTLELFKKHRKGEVSRERFLYEVRRDNNLPWITNVTSYNDAVKILKNKGIIREEALSEAYEVHYSDGVRQAKKFNDPKSAMAFAKQLISKNKALQHVDVFKAGPNFHSTADANALVAWWGPGSYFDNLSKKDSSLIGKQIKEQIKESKNKGIIKEAYENVATDPAVDRVNPYYLKRGVQKSIADEKELKDDTYINHLNKAAKKLQANPKAFHGDMFGNFETVEKADAKLQMTPVKANNHVDEDNGMKKVKGQETLKAQSAPTGENKKTTKPEGVTIMKDKGVEGSEKVIKEIASYLKKKLTESNPYHDFHEGMQVETTHGTATVKEINGGTLTVETEDGKLYDVQMNHARHFTEKKKENESTLRGGFKPYHDPTSQLTGTGKRNVTGPIPTDDLDDETDLQIGDRVKVVYGNQFYGMTGTIEDVKGGFVIVNIDEDGEDYSMHSSDVEKIGEEEDDDQFYGEDDLAEARDINDPALVSARAKLATPHRVPVATKERDLEILRQIKALKREKFQVMRDMEQEAEPEGGPIADDYADRLMDLDRQIKSLEAKLSIHEDELDETSYAGKGAIVAFKKDPKYSALAGQTRVDMEKKLNAGGSVEL